MFGWVIWLTDDLSVAAIAARMREVEAALQSLPDEITQATNELVNARAVYNNARAKAALELGDAYLRAKTQADKDMLLFPETRDEWEQVTLLEAVVTRLRDQLSASGKEGILLSSRMKAALEADRMHARFGEG